MAIALAAGLGIVAAAAPVQALTAHLITSSGLVNLTPGPDLRIGTGDDGLMSGAIPPNQSGPNAHGAASFALLRTSAPTPVNSNFQYILFVDGTIEFTPDYTASSANSLVLHIDGGALRSTAEFGHPGRGEATTSIVGTMAQTNLTTGEGLVQLTGNFAPSSGAFPLNNEVLTSAPGFTTIVPRTMFGQSGDPYIDHILTPLVPPNATAIVCVEFTGTVTTPGDHQGYETHGVLTAYTTDDLGCGDLFPDVCPRGGTACSTFAACATTLTNALPSPAIAASPKARRVALRLARFVGKANGFHQRATTSTGKKRTRLLTRARGTLTRLLTFASTANGRGTLGVSLDTLSAAVNALLAQIPAV